MAAKPMTFQIASTWDGQPLSDGQRVELSLSLSPDAIELSLDAPFYDDPPPPEPVGSTEGLWSYEVVEFFFVGAAPADAPEDIPYLEVELSPHGHHLVLHLKGVRKRVGLEPELEFDAAIVEGRWQGRAVLPRRWLPPAPLRWNAYAIHGQADARRYLAMTPVPGPQPDFHRLEFFPPLADSP